jgi:hypothetical protein
MNSYHRARLGRHAVLLGAVVGLLMAGCSASDQPGDEARAGNDGAANGGTATTGPGAAAGDSGGTSLVWGECPIEADRAPEVIQLISDVTGYDVIEESPCRFTDGARLVTFWVSGSSGVVDHRQPFVDRGYRITELDRGQEGFLAVGELDAHARADFGDVSLTLDMSSLETDHAGYERLVRGLIDVAIQD